MLLYEMLRWHLYCSTCSPQFWQQCVQLARRIWRKTVLLSLQHRQQPTVRQQQQQQRPRSRNGCC
jgi:hypothetical protein